MSTGGEDLKASFLEDDPPRRLRVNTRHGPPVVRAQPLHPIDIQYPSKREDLISRIRRQEGPKVPHESAKRESLLVPPPLVVRLPAVRPVHVLPPLEHLSHIPLHRYRNVVQWRIRS